MAILVDTPLDILLDANGDIDLSTGGPQLVSGVAGVAQLCRITLLLFRGEWFLDRTVGIPYYDNEFVPEPQAILGRKFNQERLVRLFTQELLQVPGVGAVTQLTVDFQNDIRKLSVSFEVRTTFGDTVNSDVLIGA